MEKVVRKFNSHAEAEAADRAFFRGLAPAERLRMLFEIITPEQGNDDAPEERLQRVYRVIKRGRR